MFREVIEEFSTECRAFFLLGHVHPLPIRHRLREGRLGQHRRGTRVLTLKEQPKRRMSPYDGHNVYADWGNETRLPG
jgi:hypothetical protein